MTGIAKFGAVLSVMGAIAVQAPAPAAAAQNPCTDAVWATYNTCLVSTRCELLKILCDIGAALDYNKCLEAMAE